MECVFCACWAIQATQSCEKRAIIKWRAAKVMLCTWGYCCRRAAHQKLLCVVSIRQQIQLLICPHDRAAISIFQRITGSTLFLSSRPCAMIPLIVGTLHLPDALRARFARFWRGPGNTSMPSDYGTAVPAPTDKRYPTDRRKIKKKKTSNSGRAVQLKETLATSQQQHQV